MVPHTSAPLLELALVLELVELELVLVLADVLALVDALALVDVLVLAPPPAPVLVAVLPPVPEVAAALPVPLVLVPLAVPPIPLLVAWLPLELPLLALLAPVPLLPVPLAFVPPAPPPVLNWMLPALPQPMRRAPIPKQARKFLIRGSYRAGSPGWKPPYPPAEAGAFVPAQNSATSESFSVRRAGGSAASSVAP